MLRFSNHIFLSTLLLLLITPVLPAHATPSILAPAEIDHHEHRLISLINQQRFDKANRYFSEQIKRGQRSQNGERIHEILYNRLAKHPLQHRFSRWLETYPDHYHPYFLRGKSALYRAAEIKGYDATILLTKKKRTQYQESLTAAHADLLKALEIDPAAPGAPAALVSLALYEGEEETVLDQWYLTSVLNDPGWLEGYRAKLVYLAPWRHGSAKSMFEFADITRSIQKSHPVISTIFADYVTLNLEQLADPVDKREFILQDRVMLPFMEIVDNLKRQLPHARSIEAYDEVLKETLSTREAVAFFSASVRRNSSNIHAQRGMISSMIATNQPIRAKNRLDRLIKKKQDLGFAYSSLGALCFQEVDDLSLCHGYYDEAINFETSLHLQAYYHLQRANLYQQKGMHEEAIDDYSAALNHNPFLEQGYLARSSSYYLQGAIGQAIDDLMVLKDTPDSSFKIRARTLINEYLQQQRRQEEESHLRAVTSARRAPADRDKKSQQPISIELRNAYINGVEAYHRKQYNEAAGFFFRMIAEAPDDDTGYFMLGKTIRARDPEPLKAAVYFQRALTYNPGNPTYTIELAKCYLELQEYQQAHSALSLAIDNGHEQAALYYLRARASKHLDKPGQLLSDARIAHEHDPDLPGLSELLASLTITPARTKKRFNIATPPAVIPVEPELETSQPPAPPVKKDTLVQQGKKALKDGKLQEAKTYFFAAIEQNSNSADPFYQLAMLFLEKEYNTPKGLLYLNQALDRAPKNAHYRSQRGQIHFKMQNFSAAAVDLQIATKVQTQKHDLLFMLGISYQETGARNAARKIFDKIRALDIKSKKNLYIQMGSDAWQKYYLGSG